MINFASDKDIPIVVDRTLIQISIDNRLSLDNLLILAQQYNLSELDSTNFVNKKVFWAFVDDFINYMQTGKYRLSPDLWTPYLIDGREMVLTSADINTKLLHYRTALISLCQSCGISVADPDANKLLLLSLITRPRGTQYLTQMTHCLLRFYLAIREIDVYGKYVRSRPPVYSFDGTGTPGRPGGPTPIKFPF
jgi:hypothetical protein